jgi:hypothetical protein
MAVGYSAKCREAFLGGRTTTLLAAAILANLADLVMFLRASPALVASDETNPLPHLLGQEAGGIAAKAVLGLCLAVIVLAFRDRPRTATALLVIYTVAGLVGAASGAVIG